MKRRMPILVGISPEGLGLYKGESRTLQVFYRFRELSNWQLNPLWNGSEAPDYDPPKTTRVEQEMQDLLPGPYRVALFTKTRSKKTKDVELELSSFVVDDDNAIMLMNVYNSMFERMVQLLELEGGASFFIARPRWLLTFFFVSSFRRVKRVGADGAHARQRRQEGQGDARDDGAGPRGLVRRKDQPQGQGVLPAQSRHGRLGCVDHPCFKCV